MTIVSPLIITFVSSDLKVCPLLHQPASDPICFVSCYYISIVMRESAGQRFYRYSQEMSCWEAVLLQSTAARTLEHQRGTTNSPSVYGESPQTGRILHAYRE